MQIRPISLHQIQVNNREYNTKQNALNNTLNLYSTDSVAFGNYNKVLQNMTRATLKNDTEVEKFFIELFRNIKKDKSTQTTKEFLIIEKLYKKGGFRGLLNELWKAYPSEEIEKILQKAESDKGVVLAQKGTQTVMELTNLGRFGFWGSSSNPREVKISFSTKKGNYYMDFGLEKNGEITTWQRHQEDAVYNRFHSSTGIIKQRTIHPSIGYPDTTYYNKDGTPDGWKNMLYGGPAIPT